MSQVYLTTDELAERIKYDARTIRERFQGVPVKVDLETMADDAFKNAGGKSDQQAALASPQDRPDYDAVIFGTPTRFGNMSGQIRTFMDQTGGLWAKGASFCRSLERHCCLCPGWINLVAGTLRPVHRNPVNAVFR